MLKKTFMRGLGFLLLVVTLGLTSCQAFVHLFQAKAQNETTTLISFSALETDVLGRRGDHGA